jgi:hypothetical protein
VNIYFLQVYGAGVTFFEELPEDQVTQEMKDHLKISTNDKVRENPLCLYVDP